MNVELPAKIELNFRNVSDDRTVLSVMVELSVFLEPSVRVELSCQ